MSRTLWIIGAGAAATYAWTLATRPHAEGSAPNAPTPSGPNALLLAMRNARNKKKERVSVVAHTRSWPHAAGF